MKRFVAFTLCLILAFSLLATSMNQFMAGYRYTYPADGYPVSSDGYRYADYINAPSKNRKDYPNLDDEAFANFRRVTTTGMGNNLYRGSSPINEFLGRNKVADSLIRKYKIKTIINFGNSQQKAESYNAYPGTYYSNSTVKKVYLDTKWMSDKTTFNVWYPSKDSEGFKKSLATLFKTIANSKGPYFIHCTWGRDRTGISCAILEAFMGASWDEIKKDYILSFTNFFGIQENSPEGQKIIKYQIELQLATMFNEPDLEHADLKTEAANYMKSLGLTQKDLDNIRENLSI